MKNKRKKILSFLIASTMMLSACIGSAGSILASAATNDAAETLAVLIIDEHSEVTFEGLDEVAEAELSARIKAGELSMFSVMSTRNSGAGVVTITRNQQIFYPAAWGMYSTFYYTMSIGGVSYPVYCLEPSVNSPTRTSSDYVYSILQSNEDLQKALYYGYGGPGYNEYFGSKDFTGMVSSAPGGGIMADWEVAYVLTHLMTSCFYGEDDNFLKGVNNDCVLAIQDYQGWLYNIANPIPDIAMSFSDSTLTAAYDSSSGRQKTTTVKYNADHRNTVTIPLQSGVTLHNVTRGTATTGNVTINGGDSFYLSASADLALTQNITWNTGELTGSINSEWFSLVILTSETTQTMGGGAYYSTPPPTASFSVKWLELGKIKIEKTAADGNIAGLKFRITGNGTDQVVTTGEDGTFTIEGLVPGDYKIRESASPDRYLELEAKTVTVKPNKTTSVSFNNILKKFRLAVTKLDSETGRVQGNASLQGAVYGIYQNKTLIDQYTTDENGQFTTPYYICGAGWTLKEISPSQGYLLDDTEYPLGAEPKNFTVEKSTLDQAVSEQIIRGDIKGVKIGAGTHKRLADIPFRITSTTTGENHIIVTDSNGQFTTASSWASHKNNTNLGETSADGIWFGAAKPDDSYGALPYDTYEIEELRCASNKNAKLIPAFEIVISGNNKVVDLGTLTDEYEQQLTIQTTAADKVSGGKTIAAGKDLSISDTVTLTGLVIGKAYKLTGWQMIKEENAELIIAGKRIENDYAFTATDATMKVAIEFSFDGSLLGGKNLVSFEELYDMTNPKKPVLVAKHKDIADAGQTVGITEAPKPKPANMPESAPNSLKSVKTGDPTAAAVLLGLLIISALGIAAIIIYKKKQNKKSLYQSS